MTEIVQHRGGTAAAWTAANTVLYAREIGVETDTDKFKIGDGSTPWNALPYAGGGGSASEIAFTPSGTIAATNVQAALEELDSQGGGGGGTAAATTFTPAGKIAATNVQAALEELDAEKAALTVVGVLADRPTAAAFGPGFYFATDANRGTLYYSNGTTWRTVAASSNELGYAESVTNFSVTNPATPAHITGMTVAVTTDGSTPIIIEAGGLISNSVADTVVTLQVWDGTITGNAADIQAEADITCRGTGKYVPIILKRRFTPPAGSHTYKLTVGGSGTTTLTTAAYVPTWMRVTTA